MKTLIINKLPRILKAKKQLEKKLKVKITNQGTKVSFSGKAEDEYEAEKILDALNLGFPMSEALLIKEEGFDFEAINIKDHTKRKDLERIRARIIGKKGKTLATLSQLTKCFFEIKDNEIGIIAYPENMQNAQQAIIQLIKGSKQANVYKFLEKHRPEPVLDLGLKKNKTNNKF